jgi:ABC-2 type transport system ATP-binding protein
MGLLVFEHVVKRFGDFTALDDLSFDVPEGAVFGFLGGNGAGKTTSLRMVLDILRPTSGRIEVLGRAPGRENATQLGFLPEERGLYARMTVLETIVYFARLKGMTTSDGKVAARRLIARLGLTECTHSRIQKLSKGMQQKVQVAAAMVNAPRLLILDEPFSGLDPVNQSVLEEVVLDHAKTGATVVFSTHVMQHAERLSTRLILLKRGVKVFEGTQEEARNALPSRLSLSSQADPAGLPGIKAATQTGADGAWTSWDLQLMPGASPADLLQAATSRGFLLRSFETHKPSLHEVFLHLVGEEKETAK